MHKHEEAMEAAHGLPRGARVARSADGLRLELDPVGVAAGSGGLDQRAWSFGFGTLLFTVVVGGIALLQLNSNQPNFVKNGGIVLLVFVMASMWTLSAALASYALELGRRSTVIGVVGDTLLVERRGPLFKRRMTVPLDEIESVAVTRQYAPMHRRGLDCLVVRRRRGDPMNLLCERPRADLDWVHAQLAETLAQRNARGDARLNANPTVS